MKTIGIYIHIPFCLSKCSYCDFNSVALQNSKQIAQYLNALEKDAEFSSTQARGYVVKSIYFGGGTPSLLSGREVLRFMNKLIQQYKIDKFAELTIEINPGSVSYQKLIQYKEAGINRISMGVQSFNDKYLRRLGRLHTNRDVFTALDLLKKVGFNNISIDLMYGLPKQTLSEWEDDLDVCLTCDLDHISFYDLTIEKGTSFYRKKESLAVADEDLKADMYLFGRNRLIENGFVHYEISSFAKNGKESQHNKIYWHNAEYLGLGAGAYSYIKGMRFSKNRNVSIYKKEVQNKDIRGYDLERLEPEKQNRETVILNMRLLDGFSLKKIEKGKGIKIQKEIIDKLDQLHQQGFVDRIRNLYRLTERGILFYDTVAGFILA